MFTLAYEARCPGCGHDVQWLASYVSHPVEILASGAQRVLPAQTALQVTCNCQGGGESHRQG